MQKAELCTAKHFKADPTRCLVAHEMVAMVDPFAATALLHHQIAASVLPAAHPNYEACQEGTVLASLCLDQAIHAYPRENASRYVLRSAPAEKDPLPTAPITAVNASITQGGPVLVRAWVHNSTADPTLQWLAVDLKDLPPRGTPSKLSRHLDVDRVVVPASNVLHPVTASSHTGLPQLYHGAACHGASKILLHNALSFLDTSYHHAIRPPYATLGRGSVQRALMPHLADCVVGAVALTLPPVLSVPGGMRSLLARQLQQLVATCHANIDEVTLASRANRMPLMASFAATACRTMAEPFGPPTDLPTKADPSPYWFLPVIGAIPFRSVRRRFLNLGFSPHRVEFGRLTILLKYREAMCRKEVIDVPLDDPVEYSHARSCKMERYRTALTERVVYESVVSFLRAVFDRELQEPLALCLWMYGLRCLHSDLSWFTENGMLGPQHGVAMERQFEVIAGHLTHRSTHLVAALSIPVPLRKSPMAAKSNNNATI